VRSVARAARTVAIALGVVLPALATPALSAPSLRAQPAPTRPGAPLVAQPLAAEVRAGVLVLPDTVTVGDPFTVVARVRVPEGADVRWPVLDDTAAVIAPRAPRTHRISTPEPGWREEVMAYPVTAWDTGALATEWPAALVVRGADTVPVRLADARIVVRSVLPPDTAQHVPRPAKGVFALPAPWWQRWWPLALLLAALAALSAWRWWRRHRTAAPTVGERAVSAYDRAERAFARLEVLDFTGTGEQGRTVALALEIVRAYLAARVPGTSLAHTSAELLSLVAGPRAPAVVPVDRLLALLVTADAVKYARQPLEADEARGAVREARALVGDIERAVRERERPVAPANDNAPRGPGTTAGSPGVPTARRSTSASPSSATAVATSSGCE
jgi:hypothetical protein